MKTARLRTRKSSLALAAIVTLGSAPLQTVHAAACTFTPPTGNWSVAGNWSCGVVPTGGPDSATIGAGKAVTVNSAQSALNLNNAGSVNIDAFLLTLASGGSTSNTGILNVGAGPIPNNAALQVAAGHNIVNTGGVISISADSVLNQFGSTLTGGTINTTGSGKVVVFSNVANFLSGVTLNGTLDMSSNGTSRQRIINGATINGAVNIANGGVLSLDSALTPGGNQTLGGNATINLNDSLARLAIDGTGTTTLASTVTVRGQGNIGSPINLGGTNTLVNNGLISADVSGGTLNITVPGGGSGSLVNNGTLQATGGGTLLLSTNVLSNSGSQFVAGAGSAVVQNGVRLTGVITASGAGSFQASSNVANILDGVSLAGTLDLGGIAFSRERIVNGATINGAVNIANNGVLSLDSALTPGGNQTLGGNATINLNDPTARLAIDGTGTTTLASTVTVRGQGNIGSPINLGGTHTLVNNGLISADVGGGTLNITTPGGGSGGLVNNGTLQANSGGTLQLSTNVLSNSGSQFVAAAGSAVQQNGVRLTGVINFSGAGSFQATSDNANFLDGATFNGTLNLAAVTGARERIVNGATLNGAVNIGSSGILVLDSSATSGGNQTLAGSGVINLNAAGARLALDGSGTSTLASGITVRGQGNIGSPLNFGGTHTLVNNGTLLADGGTLTVSAPGGGVGSSLTGTGTLQTSGGTLDLNTGSASTQGRLVMGGAGSALNLNAQNLIITNDYTNAQAGSGNSFNRRAGVTGAGQIVAGGNAAQSISGTAVTGGNTTNATLTIGNVRVGANNFDYTVGNSGTTGPTLRGALQTSVNGANLSDARLSGGGVTAGNYNAGAPAGSGETRTLTFTAASAGTLTPLSGQVLNLRSNFENIADQKLNIVIGGGAAAFNAAVGSTITPVQVAHQRVGGSNSATLSISNTAPAGAFSEDLHASVASFSGQATANGSVAGRLAGTNNTGTGAITVGVDTATAGAKTGSVNLNYQTAGTVNGVSNGLGTAAAGSQAVTVNGNVYQAAAGQIVTPALNFGTLQVGQQVSQNLVVRNTASGPSGFVEDLSASFGASGNSQISGSGGLSGILAGSNSSGANGTMTVTVTGATAGVLSSGIAVNYTSAGAVAGVSNGLGTLAVGSETYGVNGTITTVGNVINQASPLLNNPSINLGAVRVGAASPTANVSLTNQATSAPQAALNASIISNGAPVTASGSFSLLAPGQTNNSSLQVGLNTAVAGNYTGANAGSATISLVSDAGNVGNCTPNCQLTLTSQNVSVSGKVYTQAVGQLGTPVVDFGIVRVGDTVSARNITVNNAAASTALNDTLRAGVSGVSGPFTPGGAATGVVAGGSGQIAVGLGTTSAGVFSQNASVNFTSQNADMADVSAGADAGVQIKAQVNNLANADFELLAGAGQLSLLGDGTYLLNLGNIMLGSNGHWSLEIENDVGGPADLLRGDFDLTGADDFGPSGWAQVLGLAAGDAQGNLELDFNAVQLGSFSDTIDFRGFSFNASDPDGLAQNRRLIIQANVVDSGNTVPEPGTLALLLVAAIAALRTRRKAH